MVSLFDRETVFGVFRTTTESETARPAELPPPTRRKRRRRTRRAWLTVGAAAGSLVGLILALMWLGGLHRPTWASTIGSLSSVSRLVSFGRGDDDGSGHEEMGMTWLGSGQADLGEFSIQNYDPLTKTHLRSEFRLVGAVTCDDETTFFERMRTCRQALREQVMVAIRDCDTAELADHNLKRLQKKIVLRVNRALDCELLKSLDIREFALYESADTGQFLRQDDP